MNIERDLAIALRVTPFANTSSILTWFSLQRGRFATLAKGAHRYRGAFLGQADLFYTCEILYYPGRDPRRLAILKECAPLKTRDRFRDDWRAMLCASYAGLLTAGICPERAPHPRMFRLLERFLDELTAGGNRYSLLFWFELQVLSEMGLAPNFQSCTRCGTPVRASKGPLVFSACSGGLVCAACRARRTPDGVPVQPDTLALLSHWQRTRDPLRARRAVARRPQLKPLEKILGEFLCHHLDALYPGRGLALQYAG